MSTNPVAEPVNEASDDTNQHISVAAQMAQELDAKHQQEATQATVPVYQEVLEVIEHAIMNEQWLQSEAAQRIHQPSRELGLAIYQKARAACPTSDHTNNIRTVALRILRTYESQLRNRPKPMMKPAPELARPRTRSWMLPDSI